MTTATRVAGIRELLPRFDAFVLDQWGVLHEGNACYPGVLDALRLLRDSGRRTVILTNSSKSGERNVERLATRFGVPPGLYDALVSSADLVRAHLAALDSPRVLVVADEGDEVLLDGLAVRRVPDGARADAIVLLSVRPRAPLTEHLAWVTTGVARGLPVYCPSADLHSVRPDGVVYGMAELVAEYRARGGTVVNFGKPEPAVYRHCAALLGDIAPDRVLMVGDQLASDVLGAQQGGWAAALVETGAGQRSAGSSRTAGIVPDLVLPSLRP
ncbi:HAD superfamily hydrolase (TIGR01459 family) [Kitasatospora sp. GP30]|uniref:TIGR01459 family HAD-type hydrolase n=1 Tax=Kitasatospora sp. GP30 TaxID=3035084 RepID=UPI000CC9044C|nr:TIGR01459 family HAD-type hydrolase [Kitasatospora sp. GP30]MDH6139340.1 HAD superfamily hydrolase (TIGR01459 family) [Kitasatospora sp. GP30]